MRYQDPVTGEWKTISVKAADTLPIGTIVDYDGDTVPDGWEEVPDYSTDEIDTGQKWIDGKPIYRRVIEGSTPTSKVSNTVGLDDNTIDNLIQVGGWWQAENNQHRCGFLGDSVAVTVASTEHRVHIYWNNTEAHTYTYVLVLEYTKTTDQGGNS